MRSVDLPTATNELETVAEFKVGNADVQCTKNRQCRAAGNFDQECLADRPCNLISLKRTVSILAGRTYLLNLHSLNLQFAIGSAVSHRNNQLMQDTVSAATIEFGAIITGLGGGLALFLFGMRQMTESLKTVAGSSMKNLLGKLTRNRFTAAVAGVIVTAIIQSSSVTTVLVVGFISAGLLTLSQSIGVIIGANVGTTITAQIIAFQIYKYGLLMIAVGFLLDIVARSERVKHWGMALMGLGLIFFGMDLMSTSTGPLRAWPPFLDLLTQFHNPFLAIAIGAAFTAIVQSSSATTGIVIVLASQGLITLESGIGLCLGANIGTCVTVMMSSMGRPREAIQAAWVHVIFNVGGVLLWMFFIPTLANLVEFISPASSGLTDPESLAADTPRQIANAHTVFNIGNAFVFIWLTGPLAKLVDRIVPRRPEPVGVQPKYLDAIYLEQPAMALDQVRRELVRMAEITGTMVDRMMEVTTAGSIKEIRRLESADDHVDDLYDAIVTYLGELSLRPLVPPQPKQLQGFLNIANHLENIGDVIGNELTKGARKRIARGVTISPTTADVLQPIQERVRSSFEQAVESLRSSDHLMATAAAESKNSVTELSERATAHLAKRLVATEPNRLATFKTETEIIEDLRRVNSLTCRLAKVVLAIENGKADDLPDEAESAVKSKTSADN